MAPIETRAGKQQQQYHLQNLSTWPLKVDRMFSGLRLKIGPPWVTNSSTTTAIDVVAVGPAPDCEIVRRPRQACSA